MSELRDDLVRCIHCGECLKSCPTYRVTDLESASPRGRLALIRAAGERRLEWTEVRPALDACLGCRACESACPVGVPYGHILLAARAEMAERAPRPGPAGFLERLALRHLVPSRGRLRLALRLARLAAPWLPAARSLAPRRPPLPRPSGAGHDRSPAGHDRSPAGGAMAVFAGCVQEAALPETNRSTEGLLRAAGLRVVALGGQTCCGALAAHAGYGDLAAELARRNVAAWRAAGEPALVTNAGGCGAMLREYGRVLPGDDAAARLAEGVCDLSQVLAGRALGPGRPLGGLRLAYQESCHLLRGMGVRGEPRALLRALPDAEYVELPGASECCGAAGAYALLEPGMSRAVAERMVARVRASGARLVVTENIGCYLQLESALRAAGRGRGGGAYVVALPDLLAAVYL